MSNTRHAQEGAPLRQERFASAARSGRGLMANLVVKRTETLRDLEERSLIWALQKYSHEEGGLEKVSEDLLALWPERFATVAMQKFGTTPGRAYKAEEVKIVRDEIECGMLGNGTRACAEWTWPLYGEEAHSSWNILDDCATDEARQQEQIQAARQHPKSYPASVFLEYCQRRAEKLPLLLEALCLDTCWDFAKSVPFYFPTLIATLREYVSHRIAQETKGVVTTEIGRIVADVCDYSVDQKIMSLVDGMARTGKTFQAKVWCAQNPGRARYVQVPSSNDETGFYRAIARALGVSINLNSKAHHLRDRIEDVLQSGQLALVMDEAHFLWPTSNFRGALPRRISWICTALVNHGVPVILIATPQFFISRAGTVEKSHYNCDQFDGRLSHYERLPDKLGHDDLANVARALLPEGSAATISGLVSYAQSSAKYLAGISAVITRSRFLARRDGRTAVQAGDVRRAMKEGVLPSDEALAKAVDKAGTLTRPKRGLRAVVLRQDDADAEAVQNSCTESSSAPQASDRAVNFTGQPVAATIEHNRVSGSLVREFEEA